MTVRHREIKHTRRQKGGLHEERDEDDEERRRGGAKDQAGGLERPLRNQRKRPMKMGVRHKKRRNDSMR